MQAATQILYNHKADVVLTGHDHIYERFAPQDPSGNFDPTNGIRAFVVGTGGSNHTSMSKLEPNSEISNDSTFGVLALTLHAGSYNWNFVPAKSTGSFTDSGTQACHNLIGPTSTPTPTNGPKPTKTPPSTRTPTLTNTPAPTLTLAATLTPAPTQTPRFHVSSNLLFIPLLKR